MPILVGLFLLAVVADRVGFAFEQSKTVVVVSVLGFVLWKYAR